MTALTEDLASLNTELDALENQIGPLIGPAGSQSVTECLLRLAVEIPGMLAGSGSMNWKNGATTNYVGRLLRQPLAAVGGTSMDWGTAIAQAKKEIFGSGDGISLQGGLDLLSNPILGALTAQSAVVNQSIEQFVKGFEASGSQTPAQDQIHAQFQAQVRGLFANNGADLASTLAALLVYAAGSILPRIDRERQILRQIRSTLRTTRNQAVGLPPSMIPEVPNSLAIQLLCEAEGFLRDTKHSLQTQQTLNRTALESASTRVCQAKTALSGDLSSLPSILRAQAQNLFGLNDLQFKTLLTGKFFPDPRLRVNQVILRNLNQTLQAIDPSLRHFSSNIRSFGVSLRGLIGTNVSSLYASIIEILTRQVQAVRAQLEATGAGYTAAPEALAKLPGATGSQDYAAAVKAGKADNASLSGATANNDSLVGVAGAALQVQSSAYLQLVVLCALMAQVSAAYPALSKLLDANNRIARVLEKLAHDFLQSDCPSNQAAALSASLAALDGEIEKRLRGTVANNEGMLSAFNRVEQVISQQEQWLTCLEVQTTKILNIFGLGQFESIVKQAMAISALAGRSAGLAELLTTFDYKSAFNTTNNPFDTVLETLQCLLQCDSPTIRGIVSDIEPSFKLLSLGANSNHLTLPVLGSLQQAATARGNNRLTELYSRLMRMLQSLTSLSAADICAIGKPQDTCGTLGQNRYHGGAGSNSVNHVVPSGGYRTDPIIKKGTIDTVKKATPLGG